MLRCPNLKTANASFSQLKCARRLPPSSAGWASRRQKQLLPRNPPACRPQQNLSAPPSTSSRHLLWKTHPKNPILPAPPSSHHPLWKTHPQNLFLRAPPSGHCPLWKTYPQNPFRQSQHQRVRPPNVPSFRRWIPTSCPTESRAIVIVTRTTNLVANPRSAFPHGHKRPTSFPLWKSSTRLVATSLIPTRSSGKCRHVTCKRSLTKRRFATSGELARAIGTRIERPRQKSSPTSEPWDTRVSRVGRRRDHYYI